jgi:D-threonate/D-erythronate kinase
MNTAFGVANHQVARNALNAPILIIADDLTGAADSAVQFRQAGFTAVVLARPARQHIMWPRTQVVSLNLNTRDASPAAVRRLWERHAPIIRILAQGAFVYQKIDSTLRGHPALEVRLLLDLLGMSAAIIAPAFPKLGRQTLDGVHRVHGLPLAMTEYARQQTHGPAHSSLPEIFADVNGLLPAHLSWQVIEHGVEHVVTWLQEHLTEHGQLVTADAADESHLDILTQAVLPLEKRLLLVGSAGWAERLALAWKDMMSGLPPRPGALGVVGSLSAVATRQVQAAMEAGVMVVPLAALRSERVTGVTTEDWRVLTNGLAAGRHAVIWTHSGHVGAFSSHVGHRVLRTLAGVVKELLSTTAVSGLAIVGGDTAQAVFRALRTSGLSLSGEVATGIPYGRLLDGPLAGLLAATKAGGFGSDLTLRDCLEFLHRQAAQLNR